VIYETPQKQFHQVHPSNHKKTKTKKTKKPLFFGLKETHPCFPVSLSNLTGRTFLTKKGVGGTFLSPTKFSDRKRKQFWGGIKHKKLRAAGKEKEDQRKPRSWQGVAGLC